MVALLTGCSATGSSREDGEQPSSGLGSIELLLELPSGESVSVVELHLVCPELDQHHTLNVAQGEVVASFGGITPGACHVEGSSESDGGVNCFGEQDFEVFAGELSVVTLTLLCQGRDETPSGGVRFDIDFDLYDCSTDRIATLEVDPADLLLGESATVAVDVYPGSVVGPSSVSFALRNDADHSAVASLSTPPSCSSLGCIQVTCEDVGPTPVLDPISGLYSATVVVAATLEDSECFDTEGVQITCLQESVCGDGVATGNEQCDDGNIDDDDGCSSECDEEYCGDGIQNQLPSIEECDGTDGLVDPALQDCDPLTCLIIPNCGNGIPEGLEDCDDDNLSNEDACTNSCEDAECGDGFLWAGVEACDDGNASSTDACTNLCLDAVCGDGFTYVGVEQCDDGNASNTDSCLVSCASAICGDGFVWAGIEECEDGNTSNEDACTNACEAAACGDGFTHSGVEDCDDGNASNTDSCVAGCLLASCGDGFTHFGSEQCDDGNATNTDGCVDTCESALISDDFNRPDGTTVGGVWTEVTAGAANAEISGNKLRLNGDNGSNRPLVRTNFTTQTTGFLMWSFEMDFTRTTEANPYFQFMQLGDGMVDGNQVTGVAVDLSWGSYGGGHNRFGYKNAGGTFVNAMGGATQLSGVHRIQVLVDIVGRTYDIRIDDVLRISAAPFRNAAVAQISQMRFFQHQMDTTATGRTIDDVKLTKGVVSDNFQRANSSVIGNGWTEELASVNPGDAVIMMARLQFNGADGSNSPLVTRSFPAAHAGTLTLAFTMVFTRTTEATYFQFIQLGDAMMSSDQANGVAVDLSWGSYGGFHNQFGYKSPTGTFVNVMGGSAALTGTHYIVIVVNFATASYDVKVDGVTRASAVPFRDPSVAQITDLRFFEDQMDSTASVRGFDNVALTLP